MEVIIKLPAGSTTTLEATLATVGKLGLIAFCKNVGRDVIETAPDSFKFLI